MACNCDVPVVGVSFPVLGPQPIFPKEQWPDFFVPARDPFGLGLGHYFCPYCKAGLNEARAAAGLAPVSDEPITSWYGRLAQATHQFWSHVFEGIYPQSTSGKSR